MRAFRFVLFSWIIIQTFYFGSFGPELGGLRELKPQRVLPCIVLVGLCWLLITRQAALPKWMKQDYYLLIVTVLLTASFITSGSHYDTTVATNKWLAALFNITYYPVLAYLCARSLPYSREMLLSFLKLLCILGAYLGITAFGEHYELTAFVWPEYIMDPTLGTQFGRARGPFGESVAMGRVLTMSFGAFLIMATQSAGWKRWACYIFAFLALGGIYFTLTRGPWIGLGLLLLAFLLLRSPVKRVARVITVCIIVSAAFGLSRKFSFTGGTLFSQRGDTVTDRVVTWLVSGKMIATQPLTGIGFGRFNADWNKFYDMTDRKGIEFTGFDGSHNTYLTMGAEVGLPALFIYLLMLYRFGRTCVETYRQLGAEMMLERSFVVMVIGISAMYAFTSWFSDLRWNTVQNVLMFFMFGLVASISQHYRAVQQSLEAEESTDVPRESESPSGQFAGHAVACA